MSAKNLDELAERETALFRQRQSFRFLECAVNLMAHDYKDVHEVARMLRVMADELDGWG